MENQKADNMLNLAWDATESERERSLNLNTGYNQIERTWDVIIKYNGDISLLLSNFDSKNESYRDENNSNRIIQDTFEMGMLNQNDVAQNAVRQFGNIKIVPLLNRYAIVTASKSVLQQLLQLPQVEYMELPKRIYFELNQGKRSSCINTVQQSYGNASEEIIENALGNTTENLTEDTLNDTTGDEYRLPTLNLTGKGVLIGIVDSGVDIYHEDFQNADGSTRIVALWDQVQKNPNYPPPSGYVLGAYYSEDDLNSILMMNTNTKKSMELDMRENSRISSSTMLQIATDISGHGTSVLGIAAGNGRQSGGVYRGIAYESKIIAVKLGSAKPDGFPRTTELMQAVNFILEKASEMQMPVAVNLSFGNTYGSHTGTSLLENYLNEAAGIWKNIIVVGSGNEGAAAGHTAGRLRQRYTENIELAVSSYETVLNVQIWKNYFDHADIEIIAPDGSVAGPFKEILGPQRFVLENTELLLYYGKPSPYSVFQEIYIDFLPTGAYIADGLWIIRLVPGRIVDGTYHLWLPGGASLNPQTRFLYPTPDNTLTIPSTACRVITVAAYDSRNYTYADFSGRGLTAFISGQKPDIAAPGVDITTTRSGGGYISVTGTSFATPFGTGSAALMMQWGIVDGNDPFLYGEKLKAYLINGARPLQGLTEYPNPQVGYGRLCLESSLPSV